MQVERCFLVDSQRRLTESRPLLLCRRLVIRAVHVFIRLVLQLQSKSGTDVAFFTGTIVTKAPTDSYQATVVMHLNENMPYKSAVGNCSTTLPLSHFI